MKKSNYSDIQIISVLKQAEAGTNALDVLKSSFVITRGFTSRDKTIQISR